MHETSSDIRFGSLLVDTCEYSKAESYLQGLLENTEREDLAHIHLQLGSILGFQESYNLTLSHLHNALKLEKKPLNIARIMQQIGLQLYQRGDYIKYDDYGEGMSVLMSFMLSMVAQIPRVLLFLSIILDMGYKNMVNLLKHLTIMKTRFAYDSNSFLMIMHSLHRVFATSD